jgi:hypothetical protein
MTPPIALATFLRRNGFARGEEAEPLAWGVFV